jgi:hypothetical protein
MKYVLVTKACFSALRDSSGIGTGGFAAIYAVLEMPFKGAQLF